VFVKDALHHGVRLEGVRFAEIGAENVELKRFVLTEVDLSGAELDRFNLEDGSIHGCDPANVRSERCSLDRVVIQGSRLTGAMLVAPRLRDMVFRDCTLELSSFRFDRLRRVRFDGCRLIEADFQGVTANACAFINCDLTGAQLSQGNFTGSAFGGVPTRGCQWFPSAQRGTNAVGGRHRAGDSVGRVPRDRRARRHLLRSPRADRPGRAAGLSSSREAPDEGSCAGAPATRRSGS
jgi:uncharacterized protein YjbI with pentapeptide repeats